MMHPIGGYFSLELPLYEEFHKNATRLNTGRNCLEYILRVRRYGKVYIPYYTCEAILEPLLKTSTAYEFYRIDLNFELVADINLQPDEVLLYTNYFGLKQKYVEALAEKYAGHLIIDNTQAFFAKPIPETETFYTCRKFFGVPDGAYLYTDKELNTELEQDESWERMDFLTKRIDIGVEAGYTDFKKLGNLLSGQSIKRMSNLTERLMQSIDYSIVKERRRHNFFVLHGALKETNQIHFDLDSEAVPMIYPYLTDDGGIIRKKLIDNKIFVAKYWPNVHRLRTYETEYDLANKLVAIPCDQRYTEKEMYYILKLISKI